MEAVYPTDLTDEQWQAITRLIPPAKGGGRPRSVNMREVLKALFYLARTGCAWRMLPKDYPPKDTVYTYFKKFRDDGTWKRIHVARNGGSIPPVAASRTRQRPRTVPTLSHPHPAIAPKPE